MNTIKKVFFAIVVCIPLLTSNSFAGNHTIAATVEITSTAINRFLNTEYNSWGIPQYVNFPYSGVNYKLALALPQIILTPGNAKLQMTFDLYNGSTDVYHFVVDPSVNIPSGQVTSPQVQAFLTDLPTQINNISWLPPWVKDTLIHYYNSTVVNLYPSKLIDQVNTTWLAQRSINVDSLALGWQVGNGVLDLIVSTYLDAGVPKFWLAIGQTSSGQDSLFILSNIQATASEAIVLTLGLNVLYQGNPNISCPKTGGAASLYIGTLNLLPPPTNYIARVVFLIDNTWYCGEFGSVLVSGPDKHQANYSGPTKTENL